MQWTCILKVTNFQGKAILLTLTTISWPRECNFAKLIMHHEVFFRNQNQQILGLGRKQSLGWGHNSIFWDTLDPHLSMFTNALCPTFTPINNLIEAVQNLCQNLLLLNNSQNVMHFGSLIKISNCMQLLNMNEFLVY